jgi:hypothetical protein
MRLNDPQELRRQGGEEPSTKLVIGDSASHIASCFSQRFQVFEILLEWGISDVTVLLDSFLSERLSSGGGGGILSGKFNPHSVSGHVLINPDRSRINNVLEDDTCETTITQLPFLFRRVTGVDRS